MCQKSQINWSFPLDIHSFKTNHHFFVPFFSPKQGGIPEQVLPRRGLCLHPLLLWGHPQARRWMINSRPSVIFITLCLPQEPVSTVTYVPRVPMCTIGQAAVMYLLNNKFLFVLICWSAKSSLVFLVSTYLCKNEKLLHHKWPDLWKHKILVISAHSQQISICQMNRIVSQYLA